MSNLITDKEAAKLARRTLGQFNTPKSYRDLPMTQEALTLVTLPSGHVITLAGFAHERQTATSTRKYLRDLKPVRVAHVIVERGNRANIIENRASFIDHEDGLARRAV